MTPDEEERFLDILAQCDNNPQRLSQWEKGFVEDLTERYEDIGAKLYVSPKMWSILESAADKAML